MAFEASLRDRIAASVDDGFAEQVAYTQELIRFPSTRGEEQAIQDFVFRAFRARRLAMDRFAMDRDAIAAHPGGSKFSPDHSEAPIVVGIHRPRDERGRSLILQSHVDVVRRDRPACGRGRPSNPRSRAIGCTAAAAPT